MSARPRVVRRRHWMPVVLSVIAIAIVAEIIYAFATSPNLHWQTVGEYLFNSEVLTAVGVTLKIAFGAQVLSLVVAMCIAGMRVSSSQILGRLAAAYVWFFRGLPPLLLVLLVGNAALVFPRISLPVPFTGTKLFDVDTNSVISVYLAGVIAIGLAQAAFMAEVLRAGLLSVSPSQKNAARAVGMTEGLLFRRIVLPQALRVIIPPASNEFIVTLKMTSLTAFIAAGDLLNITTNISSQNLRTIELLLVATAWYVALISVASIGQGMLERRFSRGETGQQANSPRRGLLNKRIGQR